MEQQRMYRVITIPVLFCILCSCSGSDREAGAHNFRIFTEDGVSVAETTGGPKFGGTLFRFEEVARLEQDEEREETLLFRANNWLAGNDGRFYVADRGNNRIAVFGSQGEYLFSFGREGDGPGEFRNLQMLWLHADTLAVWDSRNQRTSLFDPGGSLQRICSYRGGRLAELHPAGDYLINLFTDGTPPINDGEESIRTPKATVVTTPGDTVAQITAPAHSRGRVIMIEEYQGGVFSRNYFGPTSDIFYYPAKGILTFHTGISELVWYALDGSITEKVRLLIDRDVVTEEERQAIERRMNDMVINASNEQRRVCRHRIAVPDSQPGRGIPGGYTSTCSR